MCRLLLSCCAGIRRLEVSEAASTRVGTTYEQAMRPGPNRIMAARSLPTRGAVLAGAVPSSPLKTVIRTVPVLERSSALHRGPK